VSDVKTAYGSSGQALTITLINLADSATVGRESTAVDNSSDKYLDVLISAKFGLTTGTVSDPKAVMVYAYASVDGGSEWPDAVTGSDAGITIETPTALKVLGAVYFSAQSQTHKGGPWSLAALYGGRMPERWGVVVVNDSGIALSNTAGNQAIEWQGVYATVL
jgi:hypothetical protein